MSEYATVIIKPDAHEDTLVSLIIQRLEARELEVVLCKDVLIDRESAEVMYQDTKGNDWYEPGVNSLVGTATVAVLRANESAIERAQAAKGRSSHSGIRLAYQKYTMRELLNQGLSEQAALHEAAKNRLHVPSTGRETAEALLLLLGRHEWENLGAREPVLLEEIREEAEAGLHPLAEENRRNLYSRDIIVREEPWLKFSNK